MRGMRRGLGGRGREGVGAEERKRQKGEAEGKERKKDTKKKESCVEVRICCGERTRGRHGGKQGLLGITLTAFLSPMSHRGRQYEHPSPC